MDTASEVSPNKTNAKKDMVDADRRAMRRE